MRKRILIFSYAYLPLVGGAEIAVREITDRISPDDCEFEMVTVRPVGSKKTEQIGNVLVHRILWRLGGTDALSRFVDRIGKYLFPFRAAQKGAQLHRKKPFTLAWAIMAAYGGFATLFFHRKTDIPYLLTLQEGDSPEYIRKQVRFVRPWFRGIFKEAFRIQTISAFLARFAKDEGVRAEPIVIGNGVDMKRFSSPRPIRERDTLRHARGIRDTDTVLFTASRLVHKNAVDVIIDALIHLPENVRLVIAGDGPLKARLEERVKEKEVVKRVHFLGTVSHKDLPAWFHAADIFVRPSRSEGFGNVFAEAMAAGIPVIATAAGGIPDIVKDGETGLVCEVDDSNDLAEKVRTLMSDERLRERLVKNGDHLVRAHFDWETIARRMKEEVFVV